MKCEVLQPNQTTVELMEVIENAELMYPADPRYGPYYRVVYVPLELWRLADGRLVRRAIHRDTEYISEVTDLFMMRA